jgi:hypothetical protein
MKLDVFMRFVFVVAVKISMLVLCVVTPCGFVCRLKRYGGICSPVFSAEDEGGMFLQSFRI